MASVNMHDIFTENESGIEVLVVGLSTGPNGPESVTIKDFDELNYGIDAQAGVFEFESTMQTTLRASDFLAAHTHVRAFTEDSLPPSLIRQVVVAHNPDKAEDGFFVVGEYTNGELLLSTGATAEEAKASAAPNIQHQVLNIPHWTDAPLASVPVFLKVVGDDRWFALSTAEGDVPARVIGSFDTREEAEEAYLRLKKIHADADEDAAF